jgi:hypothetical protein
MALFAKGGIPPKLVVQPGETGPDLNVGFRVNWYSYWYGNKPPNSMEFPIPVRLSDILKPNMGVVRCATCASSNPAVINFFEHALKYFDQ